MYLITNKGYTCITEKRVISLFILHMLDIFRELHIYNYDVTKTDRQLSIIGKKEAKKGLTITIKRCPR